MAKPVLLVTRKLPEAIEARAAQDYDARLNPQDAPLATDGAEIARRATEASAAGMKRARLSPTPWWWLSAPPAASTAWVAASHACR